MYADDLVLMLETAEGLQNSLNILYSYCCDWGLHIDIGKTKSLVIDNTGRLEKDIFRPIFDVNLSDKFSISILTESSVDLYILFNTL
jgi:hypothetical protein